jgi:glucose/arabinose dehydrogenase
MRKLAWPAAALLLAAACTGGQQEAVSTTPPTTAPSTAPPPTGAAPTTGAPPAATEPSTTTTTAPTTTTTTLPPLQGIEYDTVVEGLGVLTVFTTAPGDDRWFIGGKDGRTWVADEDGVAETLFLDLREPVRNQGEQGLLGIAFHPDYPSNGLFYVHYSASSGATTVSEFAVSADDPGRADPASERLVLSIPQPASNHNGGMIQFGPDGFLYIGLGDGGRSNDRFGNGQRPDTPLGTILRIDVDGRGSAGADYGIPADNPFTPDGGRPDLDGDPAVWAFGLRNPWRFWIDGDRMFIADVGQNSFEELDVVALEPAGYNFGWPITEALHCFSPRSGCDTTGLTLPLLEVTHGDAGTCSITGGVTYRGSAIPELDGHFFYSDFCGGYLRSVLVEEGAVVEQTDWTDHVGRLAQVTSFGVDAQGEVYVLTSGGSIAKIVPVR